MAEVVQKDVPLYQEWVASMDGLVNATILAQVQGYLIKQNYKEGDHIKKGAPAVRDRPAAVPGGGGRSARGARQAAGRAADLTG